MLKRRDFILASGAAALATPSIAATSWPNKPVKVVVSFAAGGVNDIMTRLACQVLSTRLGQPFVVENRPGASGNIGHAHIARSDPDGYTFGTISIGNVTFNQLLFRNLGYDPERDFSYAAGLWELPNFLIVPTNHVPANNVAEFVAWARSQPKGTINFGASGPGLTTHLAGAYFARQADFDATFISGTDPQTALSMLRGEVHYAMNQLPPFINFIREGRLKVLAVADNQRWGTQPEVPTMAEAGIPNFAVSSWHMLGGPRGIPQEIVARLNAEIRAGLLTDEFRERVAVLGARVLASSPQEVEARLARERPIWAEMVRASGTQPQ